MASFKNNGMAKFMCKINVYQWQDLSVINPLFKCAIFARLSYEDCFPEGIVSVEII